MHSFVVVVAGVFFHIILIMRLINTLKKSVMESLTKSQIRMDSIINCGFPHLGGNQYNQLDYTGSGSKWATSSSVHFACFTVYVSEPKPTTTSTTGKDCP